LRYLPRPQGRRHRGPAAGRRANTCKRAGTRSRSSAASTGPRRRTGTTASWITA